MTDGYTPAYNQLLSDLVGQLLATIATSNPLPVSTPTDLATTAVPLAGTVSDTLVHDLGPFSPQIARDIWAMIVAAGASGKIQLLRSTDGGTTILPITVGGGDGTNQTLSGAIIPAVAYSWTLTDFSGLVVNEALFTATDSATYYLAITLTQGSVTYRLGN